MHARVRSALVNICLARFSSKSWFAFALESVDFVETFASHTRTRLAVINVCLARVASVARVTFAREATVSGVRTSSVFARVRITAIDRLATV
jgi:hypothetical protein